MHANSPQKTSWNYSNLFWITLIHIGAFAAFFHFSWQAFAFAMFGVFVLAPIGINVGYHRLLTHKGFNCPKWLRNGLVTVGAVIGAGPPLHWATMHRLHHRYSDTEKDPHDSRRGFWYSHIFHLFELDEREDGKDHIATYAPDLLKEPYLRNLNKYWIWGALATLPALYAWGGLSMLLWGGFMRLALTWHVMWFVNSASHMWGYRNYDTRDNTRNCWWVGVLAAGEGWHNNHHAYPSCAAHGHKWWEVDFSFMIIRTLEALGLATDVKRPPKVPTYAKNEGLNQVRMAGTGVHLTTPLAPVESHGHDDDEAFEDHLIEARDSKQIHPII